MPTFFTYLYNLIFKKLALHRLNEPYVDTCTWKHWIKILGLCVMKFWSRMNPKSTEGVRINHTKNTSIYVTVKSDQKSAHHTGIVCKPCAIIMLLFCNYSATQWWSVHVTVVKSQTYMRICISQKSTHNCVKCT